MTNHDKVEENDRKRRIRAHTEQMKKARVKKKKNSQVYCNSLIFTSKAVGFK